MNDQRLLKTEKEHLDSAYSYIAKEDWPKAMEEFKKALELNPSNIWARIELGKIYRNKLLLDSSEKEFRQVLDLSPNNEQAVQAHTCLGGIYWLRGKYKMAMEQFRKALDINPDNTGLSSWIEKTNQVRSFRKEIAPYRVFFTWGMHYECNYRCSYCYAPKPEKPLFNEKAQNIALYLGLEEWIRVWDSIYEKYGCCRIRLDGGEPSIYPSFIGLVSKISQKHLLQINTNLSFDVGDFIRCVTADRVRIDASFHPEFTSLKDFLGKVLILRENGFKLVVSCVAHPPLLERIKEYKKPFEDLRVPFITHPFSGEFSGKTYPKAYEIEEISSIYNLDEASKLVMGWRNGENKITKGKTCRMGQVYGRIYPNGDVYRCCAEAGTLKIGNIAQAEFELLNDPLACSSENCPCWKCMIVCEEERWTSLWLDEWELISI
jgi:tetratricopeptide (TPR) repeat protein